MRSWTTRACCQRPNDAGASAIRDHLAGVSVFADEDFAEYGLAEPRITDLRNWVTGWYDDLGGRLAADLAGRSSASSLIGFVQVWRQSRGGASVESQDRSGLHYVAVIADERVNL
jgi:hypothetical protein